MAIGAVGAFDNGAFLGSETPDAFVFRAELGVTSVAGGAHLVSFGAFV